MSLRRRVTIGVVAAVASTLLAFDLAPMSVPRSLAAGAGEASAGEIASNNVESPPLAEEPQLEIVGTIMIIEAGLIDDPATPEQPEHIDPIVALLTDGGESVVLDFSNEEIPAPGSRLEGSVALTTETADALDITETVLDAATEAPLAAESPEAAAILAGAEATATPLQLSSSRITAPAASGLAPAGAHNFYVAVVGAKGSSVPATSFSTASASSLVSKVGAYWKQQSGGVISAIVVKKIVRYTSAYSCNYGVTSVLNWWTEASKKLTGRSTSNPFASTPRSHLVVLLADRGAFGPCSHRLGGMIGLGYVGSSAASGGSIMAVVGDGTAPQTLAHEFGHNISLGHADVLRCTTGTTGSPQPYEVSTDSSTVNPSCVLDEYHDMLDVMGFSISGQSGIPSLSTPGKHRLGFLADSDIVELSGAGTTQTVQLSPVSASTGVRTIHVVDPVSGDDYWVEFRTPTGNDSTIYAYGEGVARNGYYFGDGVRVLKTSPDSTEDYPGATFSTYPDTVVVTSDRFGSTVTSSDRDTSMDGFDGLITYSGGVAVNVNWATSSAAEVTVSLRSPGALSSPDLTPVIVGTQSSIGSDLSISRMLFGVQSGALDPLSIEWFVNGVSTLTAATYTIQPEDAGASIYAQVTATTIGLSPSLSGVATTRPIVVGGATPAIQNSLPRLRLTATTVNAGYTSAPLAIVQSDAITLPATGSASITTTVGATPTSKSLALDEDGIAAIGLPLGMPVGTHSVRATFGGQTTAPVTVVVIKGPVTTSVTAGKPSAGRTPLVVKTAGWASLAPRGVVQIYANGSPIARTTLTSTGTATVRVAAKLVAGKKLTVQYFGDATFEPSFSGASPRSR